MPSRSLQLDAFAPVDTRDEQAIADLYRTLVEAGPRGFRKSRRSPGMRFGKEDLLTDSCCYQ